MKTPSRRRRSQTTQITDDELNAYFKYNAQEQIPVGIVEPTLNALGDGRVGGRAVVDLDAVRKQKQRGWLDPMGYLTGRLPLTATGRLITKDGVGPFQLESAEISGVTDSEDAPAGAAQLLLADARRIPTASAWTTRSSCRRASAKSASARRQRPSCSDTRRRRCRSPC